MQLFDCQRVGARSVLTAFPDVFCDGGESGDYLRWRAAGGVALVFVAGLPLLLVPLVLWRQRNIGNDSLAMLDILTERETPSSCCSMAFAYCLRACWLVCGCLCVRAEFQPKPLHSLWQSLILVRRTVLVGISVEADPLTRGMAFSIVNALFLVVHIFAMPCTHCALQLILTPDLIAG